MTLCFLVSVCLSLPLGSAPRPDNAPTSPSYAMKVATAKEPVLLAGCRLLLHSEVTKMQSAGLGLAPARALTPGLGPVLFLPRVFCLFPNPKSLSLLAPPLPST